MSRSFSGFSFFWDASGDYACLDADGRVEFRRDLYGRDAPVLKGLEAPFRIRKRGV